jgi:hypothetical protein
MRSGSHHAEMLTNSGEFIGVNLGWDFTAEHEWGIDDLSSAFKLKGVTRKNGLLFGTQDIVGVEARQIRNVPVELALINKSNHTYLFYTCTYGEPLSDKTSKRDLDHTLCSYGDYDLYTAWDKKSFGIRVTGKEMKEQIEELYDAFLAGNVMIGMLREGNPFSNAGLCFLIVSKLPDFFVLEYGKVDTDMLNLKEAAEATGIKKRLEDAGRRFYALSPKWVNDKKTEVHFWLNPMDQHLHNSAWVTVAELDEWIAGKGKIMKVKA